MKQDFFILPFIIGLVIMMIGILYNFFLCSKAISLADIKKAFSTIFSIKIIKAIFEFIKGVVLEVLLHRKIFKTNFLLGIMHASIAFGWFCLIVIGHIRLCKIEGGILHPPHKAVFLEYFHRPIHLDTIDKLLIVFNDLFLLIVLFGIFLAIIKRFAKSTFRLENTTSLSLIDKIGVVSLMLIFPIRLLAESCSFYIHQTTCAFISYPVGSFLSGFFDLERNSIFLWWLYSLVLGVFFSILPFSRFMHIFAELLLIALNSLGIKESKQKFYSLTQEVEVFSCSRCGICLDFCQMLKFAKKESSAPAYMLSKIRNGILNKKRFLKEDYSEDAFNCLLCGRCREFCPVGIDTRNMRIKTRSILISFNNFPKSLSLMEDAIKKQNNVANFPNIDRAIWVDYLEQAPFDLYQREKAEIIYFVGCMASFSPAIQDIPQAMVQLLEKAQVNFSILADKEYCCGYPLVVAGMHQELQRLKDNNTAVIKNKDAKKIVFSCPSCYHNFTHEYNLEGIELIHHTQFLLSLIKEGRLKFSKELNLRVVYHDPCDLGRNSLIYQEPRELISSIPGIKLLEAEASRERALCCGGGGDLEIVNNDLVSKVAKGTVEELIKPQPDVIITACQQCKRTLQSASKDEIKIEVKDIAELVLEAIEGKIKERR